jgi:two-component system cell cycle sensor histidine kinase/response regulator CckA
VALAHAPDGDAWAVWATSSSREEWEEEHRAAFALAAVALVRQLAATPEWSAQAGLAGRQARMEMAAGLARHLAHDFGNILTGIIGFTELAQAQQMPASSPLASYLREIHRAAQAGAQFTERLRQFSRRQGSTSRPSSLSLALAALSPRLQAFRAAGHQAHIDLPTGLPPVSLGTDNVQTILGALLDNALEAMASPGAVSVSARAVELTQADCLGLLGSPRPGAYVEVTVADTGSGLSPEAQKRLFEEPFYSTKSRRRGFGLAIAFGLLSAHQGGLRLHPGEERGVVARALFPVGTEEAPRAEPERGRAAPPAEAPSARVLVVDDEREVLASVTAALEQSGYRVQAFQSGVKALEAYASAGADPFTLVLTDVVMPELGGVELAHRLLRHDPSARVLFMSGYVSDDFLRNDFAGRQFALVNKPFRLEDLLSAVRSAVGRSPQARRQDLPREGPLPFARR